MRLHGLVASDLARFEPFPLEFTWSNLSHDLCPRGDAFVPALLLPAMVLGEPLRIEAPTSPLLLRNARTAMDIYAAWVPSARPVEIIAPESVSLGTYDGTGLFFSGGVDSFYSLQKNLGIVTLLITVHGLDVRLHDGRTFERVASVTREVARATGKQALLGRTNIRAFADRICPWIFHPGGVLAAAALSLQGVIGRALIAASYSYDQLHPWGSHPLLDSLWQTEAFAILHDGAEARRYQKVKALAHWDLPMRFLRCCWEHPDEYNCGRCPKCMLTMLELLVAGALGRCTTFPRHLSPRAVRKTVLRTEAQRYFFQELVEPLRALPGAREYAAAVQTALRRASRSGPSIRRKTRDTAGRAVRALFRLVRRIGE